MKKLPKAAIFLSLFLMGIAISFPFQIMYLFDHSIQEWPAIYYKLTNLNLAVMAIAILNSILLLSMSPLLKYTVPVMISTVLWNNYVVGMSEINYSFEQGVLGSVLLSTVCGFLLFEPYRVVLQEPNKRWWLIPQRKKISIPIHIRQERGLLYLGNTFDLSKSGAFISIPPISNQDDKTLESFEVGMLFDLKISLNPVRKIHLKAEVIRKASANGQYPMGIGVRFLRMNRTDSRVIKKIVNDELLLQGTA